MFTKKNLKNLSKEIDDAFLQDPTPNQKAWGLIHDFYHTVLTCMEENGISKAELAKRMSISRSAITQTFNETPNISVKKMVEIADAIEYDLHFQLIDKDANVYGSRYVSASPRVSFSGVSMSHSGASYAVVGGGVPIAYPEISPAAEVGTTWIDDLSFCITVNPNLAPQSVIGAAFSPVPTDLSARGAA